VPASASLSPRRQTNDDQRTNDRDAGAQHVAARRPLTLHKPQPHERRGDVGSSKAVPNYGPVASAKAALEAHIRQLTMELAPAGITANAILAGVTDTPALPQIPNFEKIMEIARKRNPNRRLTKPEDVARCIVALSHPATHRMTGNILRMDGGEGIVG
jgi:enoyl-[acyl-carrier-protein] reductase (NADH)